MYSGYLRFGGNLVVNNELTRGYAAALDCPKLWYQAPYCKTLADALDGDYTNPAPSDLPWYDPKLASESSRFLGVFGIDFTQVLDSTRHVPTIEGITDGGVIGSTRRGMKRFRMRALLAGRGRDALDYGMGWLNAIIDPDACGQISPKCGTATIDWLADCPPVRKDVLTWTEWSTVATNLATNPSMETAGASIEIRRNQVTNPRMDNSTAGWFVTAPATQAPEAGGTLLNLTADGVSGALMWAATPAVPGEQWYAAMDVSVPVGQAARMVYAEARGYTGVTSGFGVTSVAVTIQPGTTARLTTPVGTLPAGNDGAGVWLSATGGTPTTLKVTNVILEKSGTNTLPYFDGSTPGEGDFNYWWMGAADASASAQNAPTVVGVTGTLATAIQSGEWAASGSKSTRIISNAASNNSRAVIKPAFPVVAGQVYTIKAKIRLSEPLTGTLYTYSRLLSAWFAGSGTMIYSTPAPNTAGVHEVSMTVTVPAGNTTMDVRAYLGAYPGGGDLWVDDLLIVQGVYEGPFFDGDTGDSESHRYAWTGAANASTSTEEFRYQVARPETDEEYAIEVDNLRRFLRASAAESGALIAAQYTSGDFYAYEVEVNFVSETANILGVSHTMPLTPANPSVVQDIVYNLVPTPSAEIAGPEIVIQTNYSTNPSVETDAAGWGKATDGVVIIGSNMTDPASSTDIASVGTHSAKSTWTAPAASAAAGWIALQQEVVLPHAVLAGERYSINIWGNSNVQAGTPVWGVMDVLAIWRTGAATTRTDTLGTIPTRSGAVSVPTITPPLGVTSVIVRVRQNLTSWNAGTIIRIYSDALVVSLP